MEKDTSKPFKEEELKKFLKKHKKVKMFTRKEVDDIISIAEGAGEGFSVDYEHKESGTLIEQRPGKDGCIEVRAQVRIRGRTSAQFFKFIMDYSFTRTYDKMVNILEILRRLTTEQSICVYETKPVVRFLVSPRDFVYVCYEGEVAWRNPGVYICMSRSIDYDDAYPRKSGIVRGTVHHTLFLAKPHPEDKNDTVVSYIANVDAKGSVPRWVSNWVTRKFAPGYCKELRAKCLEHEEYLEMKKKEAKEKKKLESESEESESESESESEGESEGNN